MTNTHAPAPATQSWREIVQRCCALLYAAVYTYTHQSPRDSSLRVAYLGYRFLRGDDVADINEDADHENQSRVTAPARPHAPQQHRVPKWLNRIMERK